MSKQEFIRWGSMVIVGVIISTALSRCMKNEYYKQGQIDALTGNVKYALEKQDNGEMIWREKR